MSVRGFAVLFIAALAGLTVFMRPPRAGAANAATCAGASATPGAPTIDALRRDIAHARGVLPARERITTTYTYGGVAGKRVTVRDGQDERVDTTYGPLRSARGEYRGQPVLRSTAHSASGFSSTPAPAAQCSCSIISRAAIPRR